MGDTLSGKRILITQADDYMGPAICECFKAEGAQLVTSRGRLPEDRQLLELLQTDGGVDIVIANLALAPHTSAVTDIRDADWQALFDAMVHPLMRLVRAASRQMIERKRGKIIAVTSAAPLRGIPKASAYCAARGAQNAFIRAVGLELATHNVQVNAIAQNYVNNPTYYPDDLIATDRFKTHLSRHVPIKRIAEAHETAELALFLASEKSNFIVGQVIPFAGGWVTTTG